MLADKTLFTLVFVTVCGHLVSSVPVNGEIVHPGPHTYSIGGTCKDGVVARRVPAVQSDYEYSDKSTDNPNGTYTFGELSPTSLTLFYITVNYTNLEEDLMTFRFARNGYLNTFTFVEVFDTSADGVSGGTVRLVEGGIRTSTIILVVQPVRPSAPVSLFIVAYGHNLYEGGQNFRIGRMVPGLERIFSLYTLNANFNATEVVRTTHHSDQLTTEIRYIEGMDYITRGSGGLVSLEGGVGSFNVSFTLESGVGENLHFNTEFYGNSNRV